MKILKKFRFVSGMLAAMLFASCTLVMDDLPADENIKAYAEDLETVGFDEPYTQETEYGDITFQYSDSTLVLKKAAFDYLVKVDGDTTLYFTDNIPKELLIQPGHYVSMGCSRTLPEGLCNKVLSLIHENGMYKMVTTPAPQENVFDQYEADLNLDLLLMHDIEVPDSAECVEQGIDPDCPVVTDFDILDGISTPEKVQNARAAMEKSKKRDIAIAKKYGAYAEYGEDEDNNVNESNAEEESYSNSLTRGWSSAGEGEEETWTDEDSDDEEKSSEKATKKVRSVSISYNTDEVGGKDEMIPKKFMTNETARNFLNEEIKKVCTDLDLSFAFTVDTYLDQEMSIEIKLDKDTKKSYRKMVQIDRSHNEIGLKLTGKKGRDVMSYKKDENAMSLMDKLAKTCKNQSKHFGINSDKAAFVIEFPVPGITGVVIYAKITPNIGFELGLIGSVKATVYKPTTTTTVITEGKETKKKEVTKTGKVRTTWDAVEACGYLKASLGVDALIGVGVGVAGLNARLAGLAVGVGLEGYLTFNIDLDFSNASNSSSTIKLGFTYQPKFQLELLGIDLITIPIPGTDMGIEKTIYLNPDLGNCSIATVNRISDDGKTVYEYSGSFSFDNLGLEGKYHPERYRPVMYLFYFSLEETIFQNKFATWKNRIPMELITDITECEAGKYYSFKYRTTKDLGNFCCVIPGFVKYNGTDFSDAPNLFYTKFIRVNMINTPEITTMGTYVKRLWKGGDAPSEYKEKYNKPNAYYYELITKLKLENSNLIKDQWNEWGIHVSKYIIYNYEDPAYPSLFLNSEVHNFNMYFSLPMSKIKSDGIYYVKWINGSDSKWFREVFLEGYYQRKDQPAYLSARMGAEHCYFVDEYPTMKANFKSEKHIADFDAQGSGVTIHE